MILGQDWAYTLLNKHEHLCLLPFCLEMKHQKPSVYSCADCLCLSCMTRCKLQLSTQINEGLQPAGGIRRVQVCVFVCVERKPMCIWPNNTSKEGWGAAHLGWDNRWCREPICPYALTEGGEEEEDVVMAMSWNEVDIMRMLKREQGVASTERKMSVNTSHT